MELGTVVVPGGDWDGGAVTFRTVDWLDHLPAPSTVWNTTVYEPAEVGVQPSERAFVVEQPGGRPVKLY